MEFCKDENCLNRSESPVDILVKNWGYEDLLPENIPIFDEVPYHVHMFVGILLTVLGTYIRMFLLKKISSSYNQI